ncbi:MAG: tRNA lysidine(34) synthetase TilS [Candidatus Nanopelagicales bacterium]
MPAEQPPLRGRPPRARVRAAVRAALADLGPGDLILVALSGGADSLALCAAATRVGAEQGFIVDAAVVDHQLQRESAAVAQRACGQAELLGVRHAEVLPVEVATSGAGGLEAAARSARYSALGAAADSAGAATVLLGHTRDDQAETVLLGLARGSGTRSLAGMAARNGLWRRPLLALPRAVVSAAAEAAEEDDERLRPWEDPHNANTRFRRVRVRRELLPALEDVLGPGATAALARTAELARADADALDALAAEALLAARSEASRLTAPPAALAWLAVPQLLAAAPAIRSRALRSFLIAAGVPGDDLSFEQVSTLDRAVAVGASGTKARVALASGITALIRDDLLILEATSWPGATAGQVGGC